MIKNNDHTTIKAIHIAAGVLGSNGLAAFQKTTWTEAIQISGRKPFPQKRYCCS